MGLALTVLYQGLVFEGRLEETNRIASGGRSGGGELGGYITEGDERKGSEF